MGTASFSVGRRDRFLGGNVLTSEVITSGAFTTSGTAANVEDGSGDITLKVGEVFVVFADEAMRVNFGGTAATTTTGHYIPASTLQAFTCEAAGVVSIIDVA